MAEASDLMRRIPALADLRGNARLDAEEAIRAFIDEVIEDFVADAEPGETEAAP